MLSSTSSGGGGGATPGSALEDELVYHSTSERRMLTRHCRACRDRGHVQGSCSQGCPCTPSCRVVAWMQAFAHTRLAIVVHLECESRNSVTP